MSSHAIDYFATLGKLPGKLVCKSLPSATCESSVSPSEIWLDAITDITVIFFDSETSIPDQSTLLSTSDGKKWELIKYTVDGLLANCNAGDPSRGVALLAVQRRRQSKRRDHICEITVLHKGDSVPEGFEPLNKSMSCERIVDLYPHASSRLAVRRASEGDSALINGYPIVDDIVLADITEGEEAPREYVLVDKPLNPKVPGTGSQQPHKVVVSYHRRSPLGVCDMRFEACTLDRYPSEDHDGLALPVVELPMFVFPHDLQLKCSLKHDFPLPDFFTFVFTDVKGQHLYTTCLRFYELLEKEDVELALSEVVGAEWSLRSEKDVEFFAPKVICVVSQFPFYRAMERYLKQLYSLSLSPSNCPLEHFIASVVGQVPLPVPGGRPFHVVLDAALISQSSRAMAPICFDLPFRYFFPPMDLDFAGPMRCLSIDHLLATFCLLLMESKVTFVCSSNALLTEVMETFRSLLFPLTWSSCFITRLPDALSGVLQAPGGFMIGMHITGNCFTPTSVTYLNHTTPREGGPSAMNSAWMHSLQPGTYIVDLTENRVRYFDGVRAEVLPPSKVQQFVRMLPSGPGRRLRSKIQAISQQYLLCPQKFDKFGLAEFDSAFECKSFEEDLLPLGRKWSEFPSLWVRDAFLTFMCDLIGDVTKYIRPPIPITSGSCFNRTFGELFMIEEYIRDSDKSAKRLLRSMMDTQMFAYMVQGRTEDPTYALVFFDQAVHALKNLGLSALPADRRVPLSVASYPDLESVVSAGCENDGDLPLYELVERLALLSASFSVTSISPTMKLNDNSTQYWKSVVIHPLPSVSTRSCIDTSGFRTLDMAAKSIESRKELWSHVELQLDDKTKGALIIPGPLRYEVVDEIDEVRFRYESGWPHLDATLLGGVKENTVKTGLHDLKQLRAKSIEQVDSRCLLFLRPPTSRLSYKVNGCLVRAVNMNMYAEAKAATGMVIDVFSNSLLMLALRASRKVNSVGTVLQIFGILSHLHSINMLPLVESTLWRALLVACNSIEELEFGHKATCIIYSTMRSAGVNPDAFSYCTYCKNFSRTAKKQSITAERNIYWDPYFHLEQIGLSWYSQKSIPYDEDIETRTNTPVCSTPSTPIRTSGASSVHLTPPQSVSPSPPSPVPGSLWGLLRGKKKTPVEVVGPHTRRMSAQALTVSVDHAKVLGLCRSYSPFMMCIPSGCESLSTTLVVLERANDADETWGPVMFSDNRISERVGELRQIFNQFSSNEDNVNAMTIQQGANKAHCPMDVDTTPIKGKLEVAAIAINGLTSPEDDEGVVYTRNIYVRMWLSSNESLFLKTQPGIKIISDDCCGNLQHFHDDEYVTFYSTMTSDITLNVEAFGDFSREKEGVCFAFDQSLGSGRLSVDGNLIESKRRWVTVKDSSGRELKLLLSIKLSDYYEHDRVRRLTTGGSQEIKPLKSTTIEVDTPCKSQSSEVFNDSTECPEDSKSGWNWNKLSFGLYKPRKSSSMSMGSSRSTTPPLRRDVIGLNNQRDDVQVSSLQFQEFSDSDDEATNSNTTASCSPVLSPQQVDSSLSVLTLTSESMSPKSCTATQQNEAVSIPNSLSDDAIGDSEKRTVKATTRQRTSHENMQAEVSNMDSSRVSSPLSTGSWSPDKRISFKGFISATRNSISSRLEVILPTSEVPPIESTDCEVNEHRDTGNGTDNAVHMTAATTAYADSTRKCGTNDRRVPYDCGIEVREHICVEKENSFITDRSSTDEVSSQNVAAISGSCQEPSDIENHLYPSSASATWTKSSDKDKGRDGWAGEGITVNKQIGVACIDSEKRYSNRSLEIQSRLRGETGLGIFSASPCKCCGFVFLDDEVMASWAGFTEARRDMIDDILSAHKITCPECGGDIVPVLHVRQYRFTPAVSNPGCLPEEILESEEVIWGNVVQHISPFGLRFMIEHIVEENGLVISDAQWLFENAPTIYWNIIWYSSRFHLPSGLFMLRSDISDNDSSVAESFPWTGPVTVGWRECTVVSRIRRLLRGSECNIPLNAAEIFPGASLEDLETAAEIVSNIDDSPSSLAKGLTRISSLSSIVNSFSGPLARQLYLSYLFLIHQFNSELIQFSTELPSGLSKGSVFDKAFIEAISIALSTNDFKKLSVTDVDLNRASSNRAAQAIRIAYGLLL